MPRKQPAVSLPVKQMLYDRVLIKPTDAEEITPAGLMIPNIAQGKSQEGVVVALGTGHPELSTLTGLRPLTVQLGDKVLIEKYAGVEIELAKDRYVIIREADILAILHGGQDEPIPTRRENAD